jgi:hypothetical protein
LAIADAADHDPEIVTASETPPEAEKSNSAVP